MGFFKANQWPDALDAAAEPARMTLKIFIGKIRTDGLGKLKRLKLGDPVGPNDVVVDETVNGLRCIRAVAVLSPKEAGRRYQRTWALRTVAPNAAGADIQKACEAAAEKWRQKILAKTNGETEDVVELTQVEL